MPAADHKEVLQRAARNFGDPKTRAAYLDLYAPNALLHGYTPTPLSGEGIRGFYAAFWAAFPDARLSLDDLIAEGDKVVARFTVRATHKGAFQGIPPTSKEVTLTGITILSFAGGKCVERWSQADFLGLMQQMGVVPAPGQGTSPRP